MAKLAPRDLQRKTIAGDLGSFSTKYASDDKSGAFMSMAVQVLTEMKQPITDPNTYDIEIVNSPRNMRGRWIVGEQATHYNGTSQRFTRNMRRFADPLYDVFICAALRAAFPDKCRSELEVHENRGQILHQWRQPIYWAGSIAPDYYSGNSEEMIETIKGNYDFVDNKTGMLYTFKVERVMIVYEGWGIYSAGIYEKSIEGKIVQKQSAARYVKSSIAIFDAGGRTTDVAAWAGGKPLEGKTKSADNGIILSAELMQKTIMGIRNLAQSFAEQPTPLEIINAILARTNKNGVILKAMHGAKVNITGVVDAVMNDYASAAMQVYQNALSSGQGLDMLVFGGGGSLLLKPYIEKAIPFENQRLLSTTMKSMYMANAYNTYLYASYKQAKERQNA